MYDTIRSPDEPYHEYGVPRRYSYLIDPDGTIAMSYDVTDVAAHPGEVLEDLRTLRGDAGSKGSDGPEGAAGG